MANPAPPNRAAAASKALGAPGGTRYLNRGTGRMEALVHGRFPGQRGRAPAGRMPGRQAPARGPARPPAHPTNIENIPLQNLNPGQIGQRARNLGTATMNAELGPLRRQYGEVQGQEGRSQGLYQQYAGQAQTMLGNLATQQEANAKTFENRMADNALAAGRGIETSGQQQASLTGGYIAPQLQSELNAEGRRAVETGGAGRTAAQQMGFNEQNYLTGIRAAAATRGAEGARGIAGAYGKQLGQISSKEIQARERLGPNIGKIRGELEKTQFNQRATEAGLKIKLGSLTQKETEGVRKANTATANRAAANWRTELAVAQRERGSERGAESSRYRTRVDAAAKKISNEIAAGRLKVSQLTAEEKKVYDEWKMRREGVSPAQVGKFTEKLNTTLSIARTTLEANRRRSKNPQDVYNKTLFDLERGKTTGKGGEPGSSIGTNFAHMALSILYNNGKLVGQPRAEAEKFLSSSSPYL